MIDTKTQFKQMPNFLIIGAERAGTTSFYHYLKEHPEIYMPPEKEPWYFICKDGHPEILGNKRGKDRFVRTRITTIEEYNKLFADINNEKAIGEASASYIYVPNAAKEIAKTIPEVKLIITLRHPVERAYSNFLHCIERGVEPLRDFTLAIRKEKKRMQENWGLVFYYKEKGFYYKYLKHYFELFPKNQIKIFLYEKFYDNPQKVLQETYQFLEVDTSFQVEIREKHNVSKKNALRPNAITITLQSSNPIKLFAKTILPQNVKDKILDILDKTNTEPIPPMTNEIKDELINEYMEDTLKLQDLIQKDLSHWIKN